MLTNALMDKELSKLSAESIELVVLPKELQEIVMQGFLLKNDCFLSKKLFSFYSTLSFSYFYDEIACECFVNSIHMEDYVNENYLSYSLRFCNELIHFWNSKEHGKLNIIISLDDETLLPTIKFHLKRKFVQWINEDDLESYIQPILVMTGDICSLS